MVNYTWNDFKTKAQKKWTAERKDWQIRRDAELSALKQKHLEERADLERKREQLLEEARLEWELFRKTGLTREELVAEAWAEMHQNGALEKPLPQTP